MVRPFVEEYLSGRTPIPCSLCNNHLKFDQLLIVARQIGADALATGHYARSIRRACGRWLLKRPTDSRQGPDLFPVWPDAGAVEPHIISARRNDTSPRCANWRGSTGWRLAEKPDSQEICFVPGGDYKKFLDAYLAEQGDALPDTAGELVTTDGEVIGEHGGIHNFTVGQRKGLGVATGSPLYVIQINGDTAAGGGRRTGRALLTDVAAPERSILISVD